MTAVNNIRILRNAKASLSVDLFGGAITDFHLKADRVNPLTFAFTKDQMPFNNRQGAPWQGHFLCLGRWGRPSAGEIRAGLPDHGQAANVQWKILPREGDYALGMQAACPLEGMEISRSIRMDDINAVYSVEESVMNTSALGRLYNMVQHPTIGPPFLDASTIVNCNASEGFNQFEYRQPDQDRLHWPYGRHIAGDLPKIDLRTLSIPYSSVFSFIVNREDKYGWITAYSPRFRILLGYIWKREDYPWIHLWQDWDGDRLRHRGLEFGTAGLHQPFKSILNTGVQLFGEKTTEYIDAGETVERRYLSFLCETVHTAEGPAGINVSEGGGTIIITHGNRDISIGTIFKDFL